ncbi:nuclear transport factor 2 family protein [Deltaproteobacteria bacterium Smac51]|nr:nuclear transport factor 2 family protein [Deltaproteobacteria bacterium Smac51]
MPDYLTDQLAIADLMTKWMYRDNGQWDELMTLFHPAGTIEVTWFEGPFADFVEGSKRMGRSDLKTKHFVGSPVTTFNGNKAVAETNAAIIADNPRLNLGCVVHNRFFDLLEKYQGEWKIFKRQSVYDTGYFTFSGLPGEIEGAVAEKYPREYAPLAYVLEKGGFPVKRLFATKGSGLEKEMREKAEVWLKS